jgi:hypothetical protein
MEARTMSESSAVTPGAKSSSEIPQTMKAVICHGPEDYRLEKVAVPHPGAPWSQLPLADFKTGLDLVGRGTESVKLTLIP